MSCPLPRPTELRLPRRAETFRVEAHRNLYCRHYAACVDMAVRKDWESFSCAHCPLFREDKAPGADAYAFNQPPDTGR